MGVVDNRITFHPEQELVVKHSCSERELEWFRKNKENLVIRIDGDVVTMLKYPNGDLYEYLPNYVDNIAKDMFDLYVKQLEKCRPIKTYGSLKQYVFSRLSEEAYCKIPKVLLSKIDSVLYNYPHWNDYPQYTEQHGDVTLKNTLVAGDDTLTLTDGLNYDGYDISIAGPMQTFLGNFEEIVWGRPFRGSENAGARYMALVRDCTEYDVEYVTFMTAVCLLRRLKYELDRPKVFRELLKYIEFILDEIPTKTWDAEAHTIEKLAAVKQFEQIPVFMMSYKRPNNLTMRKLNAAGVKYTVVTDVDQVAEYKKHTSSVLGRDADTIGERMVKTIRYLKLQGVKKAILIEDDINILSLRVNHEEYSSKQISGTLTGQVWEDACIKMFSVLTNKMTNEKIPVIYPMRKEFIHKVPCVGAVSLRPPTASIFGMMGIDVEAMCKVCDNIPREFDKHQFDVAVNYYCIGQKLGCIQVPDVLIGENSQPTVIGQLSYEERKKLLEETMVHFDADGLVTLNKPRDGSSAKELGIISSNLSPKVHYNNLKLLWRMK